MIVYANLRRNGIRRIPWRSAVTIQWVLDVRWLRDIQSTGALHHGLHGSATVVKANSQSNGNGQISTPRTPAAPKPLNGFR